jgi:hypothetical protein
MLTTPIGTIPIEMIPRGAIPTANTFGLPPQPACWEPVKGGD